MQMTTLILVTDLLGIRQRSFNLLPHGSRLTYYYSVQQTHRCSYEDSTAHQSPVARDCESRRKSESKRRPWLKLTTHRAARGETCS